MTAIENARSREGALTERTSLATAGLVAGVLGGTALVFGVVLYAIDPAVARLAALNGAIGLVSLLFYAATNRQQLGRAMRGRSMTFLMLEVGIGLGIVGALVALNIFISNSTIEWDLTRDQLYTLQEQSEKVAKSIDEPIKIVGFFRPADPPRARLLQLAELYTRANARITIEIVNPDNATPALLKQFQMTATSPRIIVVQEGGRMAKVRQPSEDLLTNALAKIAEGAPRKLFFLKGHGEAQIDDDKTPAGFGRTAQALRDEGYEVDTLGLIDKDAIPTEVSVLVVAPTQTPLLTNETQAILAWLERGGRAVILLDAVVSSGLEQLFNTFFIDVGDDLVVDPNPASRALGFGADAPVIQKFEPHPITDRLEDTFAMFYGVRSVMPRLGAEKVRLTTLIRTSPESWAETRYRENADAIRDEDDVPGPVPIAVAAVLETLGKRDAVTDEARLVVFGDGNFADNRFSSNGGNADLFLNAVNWVAGEEQKIAIRAKARGSSRLPLTEVQHSGIMFFAVNLLPLTIIGIGFSIWAVRRRK